MINWIGFAIFGLIVGIIAKLLTPGRDPGGCLLTAVLGMAGSLVGGWIGRQFFHAAGGPAGWLGSVAGAIVLLLLYRMLAGGRA
jgi:uncharacterized membrane protein YeaQ/YmgE (transglycosylase-associated protein family)